MLIDLTREVPRVDACECRSTAIARVRRVTDRRPWSPVALYAGTPKDLIEREGAVRYMTPQEPVQTWTEGPTQNVFDFRLSPGTLVSKSQTVSFRVQSAVPGQSQSWYYKVYWLVLYETRILIDTPDSRILLELDSFDPASTALPSGPSEVKPVGGTIWDRLLRE